MSTKDCNFLITIICSTMTPFSVSLFVHYHNHVFFFVGFSLLYCSLIGFSMQSSEQWQGLDNYGTGEMNSMNVRNKLLDWHSYHIIHVLVICYRLFSTVGGRSCGLWHGSGMNGSSFRPPPKGTMLFHTFTWQICIFHPLVWWHMAPSFHKWIIWWIILRPYFHVGLGRRPQ